MKLNWTLKTKAIKNDLLNFKDEPLVGSSVFLLIILNIFIFTNIIIGVNAEVAKVPKVNRYFPASCTKHFNNIQTTYQGFSGRRLTSYRKQDSISGANPYCMELNNRVSVIKLNRSFKANLARIKKIRNKQRSNTRTLSRISKKYNTRLFETIAKMPNSKELYRVKGEYDSVIENNKKLKRELQSITPVTKIDGYSEYASYIKNNKKKYEEARADYKYWQPFRAYIKMLVFIIPLLTIFGYLYYRSKKRQLSGLNYNPVIKIISANISFLLSLPLAWYTLTLIYHVLPKTFLKNLIDFLISIGFISLLNYFAIFFVVLFFGGLIYFIQKRTLKLKQSAPKSIKYKKLISKSQCYKCEFKIDYEKEFCPFCGTKLHEDCKSCNHKMVVHEDYCSNCGEGKSL